MAVFLSAYSLVAISVDRYIAIIYPLRPRMTNMQAWAMIVAVWVMALVTSIPVALYSTLKVPGQWKKHLF